MQKNCRLYIVRHGQTDWNVQKLCQGQTDIPLNEKGKLQAKDLALKLVDVKFDRIYSSDLIRAKKTAEIINAERKLVIAMVSALRERLFGRFEGKHLKEMEKYLGKTLNLPKAKQQELKLTDVENDEELIARFFTFLREISMVNQGKNILIVTHGGIIYRAFEHLGGKSPYFFEKPMKNTGYLILESDGVEFFIKENNLF